jgi:hypothetical protein
LKAVKLEDDTDVMPQSILHNSIDGMYIVIKVRVAHTDLAEEDSTPRKAKMGGSAVAVGTGKNFVNVRPRDDDDMEEEEEEEETQNRSAKRTFTPRLSDASYPPMHLVTLPQANLQITASADATGALKTTPADESSVNTVRMDEMIEDIPQDDDFVDDNRDLPCDFRIREEGNYMYKKRIRRKEIAWG